MAKFPIWLLFMLGNAIAVLLLFPYMSGWNRLAKLYGTKQSPPPNLAWMETGSVGLVVFKGVLSVGVTSQGIYLNVFPVFRFGYPPLLIPWSAIKKIEPADALFVQRYRFYLDSPKIKIILRKELLEPAKKFLSNYGIE